MHGQPRACEFIGHGAFSSARFFSSGIQGSCLPDDFLAHGQKLIRRRIGPIPLGGALQARFSGQQKKLPEAVNLDAAARNGTGKKTDFG